MGVNGADEMQIDWGASAFVYLSRVRQSKCATCVQRKSNALGITDLLIRRHFTADAG